MAEFDSLPNIGRDDLVPGEAVLLEFAAGTVGSSQGTKKMLIINNKLSSGSASVNTLYGPDTPVKLQTSDDAVSLFGSQSPLALDYKEAVAKTSQIPVYCMAITEASGAKASGLTRLAGSATKAGTVRVEIEERVIDQGFASGDGYASIATAVRAAINSVAEDLSVSISGTGGDVILTAKANGTRGNQIRFSANILESGTGVTCTANTPQNLSGGSGTDAANMSAVISALEGKKFYWIVSGCAELAAVQDLQEFVEDSAQPDEDRRMRLIIGSVEDDSTVISDTVAVNMQRGEVIHCEDSWLIASRMAARWAGCVADLNLQLGSNRRAQNPSKLGNIPGDKWHMKPTGRSKTRAQVNALLKNGVTPVVDNGQGGTMVYRRVTMYSQRSGVYDYRLKDACRVDIADNYVDDVQATFALAFSGLVFSADPPPGQGTPLGVVTPSDFKKTLAGLVQKYVAQGLFDLGSYDKMLSLIKAELTDIPGRIAISQGIFTANPGVQILTKVRELTPQL